MKLWVDDYRPAPDDWTWAKSNTSAIAYLANQTVTDVALDHDIMCSVGIEGSKLVTGHTSNETFMPVVYYLLLLAQLDCISPNSDGCPFIKSIRLHSANIDKAQDMYTMLKPIYHNVTVTSKTPYKF